MGFSLQNCRVFTLENLLRQLLLLFGATLKKTEFTSDMYTEINGALSLENCKIQYLRTIKAHLKRQKSHGETFMGTAWGTFSELFSKAFD